MSEEGLSPTGDPSPFERRFFANRDDLVAARWWQEGMESRTGQLFDASTRRQTLIVFGGLFAVGIFVFGLARHFRDDDEDVVTFDALELQRRSGWAVGAAGSRVWYDSVSDVDAAGSRDWRGGLDALVSELAPTQGALLPYYVPTLFQVLTSTEFAAGVVPIHYAAMDRAQAQGRALADLFADRQDDTALLIDATGPLAVAAAAGVAERFEPVFTFDNWPHPLGVVPSHEVIAAALYYRPTFAAARGRRGQSAPPAFVIDCRRLASYSEESDRFDNRYLARLPGPEGFRRLGIRHLLYVTDLPFTMEPDDLNDDFVRLAAGGVDVKAVTLSDFQPTALGGSHTTYSYGGSAAPHYWFWHSYGWHTPSAPPVGPRAAPPAVSLSGGATYRSVPRQTIFSSRVVGGLAGVGKQKPSGFGRVSLRTSRTGGSSIGRSGSLGRSRSSYGG